MSHQQLELPPVSAPGSGTVHNDVICKQRHDSAGMRTAAPFTHDVQRSPRRDQLGIVDITVGRSLNQGTACSTEAT